MMNKILRFIGTRVALKLALTAAPCFAHPALEAPHPPLAASPWARQDADTAATRRLVHLHYEQTDSLARPTGGSFMTAPWSEGLNSQPDLAGSTADGPGLPMEPGDPGDRRAD